MKRKPKPLGYCYMCDEPIYMEDPHYEMPDGDFVCPECVFEWVDRYYVSGEVDLGVDE